MMAAGTGAVLMMASRKKGRMYRLTDSNSSCKNKGSKGENQRIYYSKGNYEAFARPEKPEGIEEKSAWLIGGGLASLAAACFLIRDAGMAGDKIHILEASDRTGGACDGILESCAADVRWRIILNACGICFDPSLRLIRRGPRCWMNFTGLIRLIPIIPSAG